MGDRIPLRHFSRMRPASDGWKPQSR